MQALQKNLIEAYNEDRADYGTWATQQINAYFAKLNQEKPSKSEKDPNRDAVRAVFFSNLRKKLLTEKVDPLDVDNGRNEEEKTKFNNMQTAKEQFDYQKAHRRTNTQKWVHNLEIMPKNMEALRLDKGTMNEVHVKREQIDREKLDEDMEEIDADELIAKLGPILDDPSIHDWPELTAVLELCTGRRTTEVLKTAKFYINPSQSLDGYECMFAGQIKQRADSTPFPIPLLAPFGLIDAALKRVRELVDTEGMGATEINQKVARRLNNYTTKVAGCNPHGLRSIYAVACYNLLKGKKPSLIGFISRILGHQNAGNAAYYQRMVVKIHSQYDPVNKRAPKVAAPAPGWNVEGAVEKKRAEVMEEMMLRHLPITASSVKRFKGGTMAVIDRVIRQNRARIDEYNQKLQDEGLNEARFHIIKANDEDDEE